MLEGLTTMVRRAARVIQRTRITRQDPHAIASEVARLLQAAQTQPSRQWKTIRQLAAEWLPRKLRALESADSFESRVKLHILPAIGDHTTETLGKPEAETFLLDVRQKMSAQTANHVRDAARQLMEDAIDRGEWRPPNWFAKLPKFEVDETDKDVLSREETAAVLSNIPRRWRPLFALAIYLGPRRKTIFHMRPTDVDLSRGVINFNTTKTRKRVRNVPIPDQLLPFMREAVDSACGEWLFSRNGRQLSRHTRTLTALLARALHAAAVLRPCGTAKITFHGLRRLCSTLHQDAGCHPWVVSRVLGHSQASLREFGNPTENITAKHYTTFSEEFVRRELNKLQLPLQDLSKGDNMKRVNARSSAGKSIGLLSQCGSRQTQPVDFPIQGFADRILGYMRFVRTHNSGCWLWIGDTSRHGYAKHGDQHAARVMVEMATGRPVPEGALVSRTCSRADCVNPAHLTLGGVSKPKLRGAHNGRAKLTEAAAKNILRMLGRGTTQAELARKYGVSSKAIRLIANGTNWSHLHRDAFEVSE